MRSALQLPEQLPAAQLPYNGLNLVIDLHPPARQLPETHEVLSKEASTAAFTDVLELLGHGLTDATESKPEVCDSTDNSQQLTHATNKIRLGIGNSMRKCRNKSKLIYVSCLYTCFIR